MPTLRATYGRSLEANNSGKRRVPDTPILKQAKAESAERQ